MRELAAWPGEGPARRTSGESVLDDSATSTDSVLRPTKLTGTRTVRVRIGLPHGRCAPTRDRAGSVLADVAIRGLCCPTTAGPGSLCRGSTATSNCFAVAA